MCACVCACISLLWYLNLYVFRLDSTYPICVVNARKIRYLCNSLAWPNNERRRRGRKTIKMLKEMTTPTVPPECIGGVCMRFCCVSEALSHRSIEELVHWTVTRRSHNCELVSECEWVCVRCYFPIRPERWCLFIGPVNPPQLTGINLWIIILYQFPCASAFIII